MEVVKNCDPPQKKKQKKTQACQWNAKSYDIEQN
jgi:hypothetical protein